VLRIWSSRFSGLDLGTRDGGRRRGRGEGGTGVPRESVESRDGQAHECCGVGGVVENEKEWFPESKATHK
jgi:hypothetical protein